MKMNRPEMEVVRFEVADVIATSYAYDDISRLEGMTIVYRRNEPGLLFHEDGVTPLDWGGAASIANSFNNFVWSEFGVGKAPDGYYHYENGVWSYCGAYPA